jgi:hypothetical protein
MPLLSRSALSAEWLANVDRPLQLYAEWWGYPRLLPVARPASLPGPPLARTGLCFSGGIDSFWTLIRSGEPIDDLVVVLGYDVPLEDAETGAAVAASTREMARRTGKAAIVVETSLREHPRHQGTN